MLSRAQKDEKGVRKYCVLHNYGTGNGQPHQAPYQGIASLTSDVEMVG